jgi:hypothetical protein
MTLNRHLLPDEFDLLLDGESGFGVQQLTEHLKACDDCRVELDGLRAFVLDIETLPELTPMVGFADRVMHEVHVFEPWHVALRTTATQWLPATAGGRVAAGAALTGAATLATGGAAWAWAQRESSVFVGGVVADQARSTVIAGAASAVDALTGPMTSGLSFGLPLLAIAGGALLASGGLGYLGLKAAAARAQRLQR